MKKSVFVEILFGMILIGLIGAVLAEEFKSCSLDSDCKIDVCNENSCVNQSSLIPEGCNHPYLIAKECRCSNNICEVSVGSAAPVCDVNYPEATYCKDEKTMMVCSGGNWISKDCVYKCQAGSCITGCYKNEDCGGSYIKNYCSENSLCSDTVTPICLNSGICSSTSTRKCTLCANSCKEGRCSEETTTPTTPAPVQPAQPTQVCTDSDNGNFYEKGIMKNAADDSGHWDGCGGSDILTEYYCENNEARKTTFNCPNGCVDGACVKGEPILERVTCIFKNSNREQKCYLSEYNDKFYCSGKESCVMNVKGSKGEKMVWKSTCGSYVLTLIDGQDENAEFDCKAGETTTTQIQNKGFRYAYWKCYDGAEEKQADETSCKSSETWQKYAREFCMNRCIIVGQGKCQGNEKCEQKCGVNSFSVSGECYLGESATSTESRGTSAPIVTSPVEIIPVEQTESTTVVICKDSCPLDGKCYPFGYRKSGQYCTDNGGFEEQLKSDSECDNNFECSSNVCVSGKCLSEGFINKIMNWFKKLFGEREKEPKPAPTPTPTPAQEPNEKTKDEFMAKLKNPEDVILIDFESLPDKTILQNRDKLTGKEWGSLGVIFETPSEEYLKVVGPNYPFNPLDKLSLSPGLGPFEDGSETHDDLNIIFTEPVKAAGFYLLDLGETDGRESIAFLDKNGNVLYKISPWPKSTFGNPAPGTFISFISEKERISKIEILENTQDSDDVAYDNLYFVK